MIVDKGVKDLLPGRTWEQARTRINDLFRNAGGLQAIYLKAITDLPYLNLTDGVVECYLNSAQASYGFRINVYNRLNALGQRNPALITLAKRFNQPSHYSVDAGRSFTVKEIFAFSIAMPELVCITYGVIAVANAFAVWSGLVAKRTKTTLATMGSASQEEQLTLGITLGNLIAHELRHQLALSKTGLALDHSGSGLGMEGADFNDPKIRFSDEDAIRANLAKLRKVQGEYEYSRL